MQKQTVLKIAPLALAALIVACSPGQMDTTTASPPAGSDQVSPAASADAMADEEAAEEFLALVCPTDSALQILANLPIAEGGWSKVRPQAAKVYVQAARDAAARAASELQEPEQWPPSVGESMAQVADEYLELLSPLEQMNQATSGAALKSGWDRVIAVSRTAEQRVRLALGLGVVGSADDGCPPAPKVTAKATTKPKPKPSTSNSGSSSWTTLWQSPSGNLRCGFAPSGSLGVPVAACLDSDTNTLARLPKGYFPAFTQATSSQRAQLAGGRTLNFYQSISEYGFLCSLEDQGMTCLDSSSGAGFVIRRGVFYAL